MQAYKFTSEEQKSIIDRFSEEFFCKVQNTLISCAKKWHLVINEMIPYLSVNCIFSCHSEFYGEAILKIGYRLIETATEAGVLTDYSGHKYCRIYASDVENGVLLIEMLSPGKSLYHDTDSDQRIKAFAKLYNDLHIPSFGKTNYPTYRGWIERFVKLAINREDIREHGSKALSLYDDLIQTYNKSMLLHGDLHHNNIISDSDGYTIIDPKGVVGDPIFDCSRFIMEEFCDSLLPCKQDAVLSFVSKLGKEIGVPADVLLKCLYIETVIWMGEDLFYFNWLDDHMVENVLQAEILMNLI